MWAVLVISIIFAIFFFSKTAHAGLISFMSRIVGSEEASANINTSPSAPNSQTIAILQAAANPDPNPNKPAEVVPVDKDTLIADISASEYASVEPVNTQISVYTVRSGDNLSTIAELFGVSVNTIMWSNDITKASSIQPGDVLVILPVTGITHTIKKGDTITKIVSTYKADLDEVLQYNGISLSSTLVPGESIIIPDAELPTSVPTKIVASSNPAHDTGGPNYAGYYSRPVVGGVRTQGLHGYNGVDIAAPSGTPVYAAAGGTVILSRSGGYNGGYGTYIIISHDNGTQTLYAHNTQNLVAVGQKVEKGDKIALMGATGKATGSHVHFEIRGAKNPF